MSTATDTDVRTFRGRSLDEILPQVRAELGADAIVLRRREGLAGGVAGFFQRPYVEVDARVPLPGEADEVRNDRATQEGLASPAIQALVEQASPFADALTRAQTSADDILAAVAHGAALPAGLYGPQPNFDVPSPKADDIVFEPLAPDPAPSRAAATATRALVTAGLSESLAADVVALATGLRALEVEEVPLALPATISAPAADELSAALAPLGVTHVALTHADQTARPGAPVELAISARRALSYVIARESIEPADPAALAKRLLP